MFSDNGKQFDDFFGTPVEHATNGNPSTNGSGRVSNGQNLKDTLVERLTIRERLRLLPKILSTKERYIIGALLVVMVGSIVAIPIATYYHYTVARPTQGGSFSEGILGEPRLINPLLTFANDADRDLVSLVYSGLLRYDEKGKLVPDLAKSYEVSADGLTYTVYLKENAKWHDNVPVTADDVLFTIETAQNADYASPQRVSWQGVEIGRVNDHAVMFKLKNRYAQFLNALTLGIMPKHIWQEVQPNSFTLSEANLKPIGSGPYKFSKLTKDRLGRIVSYELQSYKGYYDGQPHIDTIEFKFYDSEDQMIEAYNSNDVEGLAFISPANLKKLKFQSRLTMHTLKLPRYFGLFFNQNESRILADKNVRLALNYAIDRQALITEILEGNGTEAHSPMVGSVLGQGPATASYALDTEKSKQVLATTGWSTTGTDGILLKGKDRLALTLTTSTWPELVRVAEILKASYKTIGVDITIQTLPIAQLQQAIKERNYQMLLFGEIVSIDPDPFSLWHSSQKREPGLNLALYDNKTADAILEDARQTLNPLERGKKYADFETTVIQDAPAVFLYSPHYLYPQTRQIQGMDTEIIATPANRFDTIGNWYIDTQREIK